MDLSERFEEALKYAARLHAGQRRKISGGPYLGHLLRVCGTVMEFAQHEDEVIAAVLHDAVEDQGGAATAEKIRSGFGDRVAALVQECSDTDRFPKPPWRERKIAYLAHLPTASRAARLICAADKLDNVRSLLRDYRRLGEAIWEGFRGGREGTLWYFLSVVRILQERDPGPLSDELQRAVEEFRQLLDSADPR